MTTKISESTATTDVPAGMITTLGEYVEAVKKLRKRQNDLEQFGRKIDAAEAKYAEVKARIEALNERRASAMMNSFRSRRGSISAHEENEFRNEETNILDVEHDIDFEEVMIPALKAKLTIEAEAIAIEWRELRRTGRLMALDSLETHVVYYIEQLDNPDTTLFQISTFIELIRDTCEAHNQFRNYPPRHTYFHGFRYTNGNLADFSRIVHYDPELLSLRVDLDGLLRRYSVFDKTLVEAHDQNKVNELVSEMCDLFLVQTYSYRERELEWRSHETPAKLIRNANIRRNPGQKHPCQFVQEVAAIDEAREQLRSLQSQPF